MSRMLGVAVLALVILTFSALAMDSDEPGFEIDRAERVKRIDFEIGQVAVEAARLEAERLSLMREKACTAKARDKKGLRACSLLR